jgi:hypothetical protein
MMLIFVPKQDIYLAVADGWAAVRAKCSVSRRVG